MGSSTRLHRRLFLVLAPALLAVVVMVGPPPASAAAATYQQDMVAGWNLISVGVKTELPAPDLFGPECRQVSRWNPGTSAYEEPATLRPGEGCWVKMAADATVTITGEALQSQELALAQGWNQVGNPFTESLPWAGVQAVHGAVTKSLAQAQAAGWLDSVLVYNGRQYAKPDLAAGGLALGEGAWVCAGVEGVQLRFNVQAPKQWTVMLYLDGENGDIQTDILKEFEIMIQKRVGSDANVNVVAQLDRIPGSDLFGGWTETHRFYVTPGMEPTPANAIADWGDGRGGREVNTADAANLRDFLTWAAGAYPAERYALIVADHGYGWKGLCVDETSLGETMAVKALAAALQGLPFHLDLLELDACLMQSIEVGYELKSSGIDMVVGSEAPGTTWPLTEIIGAMTAEPSVATDDLAKQVCDLYFAAHPDEPKLTLSAYRPGHMEQLAADVRSLTDALITPPFSSVKDSAQAVMQGLEETVFYSRATSAFAGSHGLSIYFPAFEGPYHQSIPELYNYFYQPQQTSFSHDAGWRGLLWQYYWHYLDLDPRLYRARSGVLMIEDTADLYDLCARIVAED